MFPTHGDLLGSNHGSDCRSTPCPTARARLGDWRPPSDGRHVADQLRSLGESNYALLPQIGCASSKSRLGVADVPRGHLQREDINDLHPGTSLALTGLWRQGHQRPALRWGCSCSLGVGGHRVVAPRRWVARGSTLGLACAGEHLTDR